MHTQPPMTTDSAEPWVARVLCALSLGQISAAECTSASFGAVLMDSLFLHSVLWHFFIIYFLLSDASTVTFSFVFSSLDF